MVSHTNDESSSSFSVSNGVRQGGVLSPYLFAVYLDSLLVFLWCWLLLAFVVAFCYADDVVLLAPCASALRKMLSICSSYANSHGLSFNAEKTQLICFSKSPHQDRKDIIYFNDVELIFSDHVLHLGHLLSSDLNDKQDIVRVIKDVNYKANLILYAFRYLHPFLLTSLQDLYTVSPSMAVFSGPSPPPP